MATKLKSATPLKKPSRLSKQRWTPHGYQKKAVKFLLEHDEAALFLDPGLGKTSITYAALKILKQKGMFKGALVLAPLRPVYSVWPKEREKWEDFEGFSVGILHDDNKDAVLAEHHDIYVMNFEGIEWLFGTPEPNYRSMKNAEEKAMAKLKWQIEMKAVKERLKLLFSKVDVLVIDELSKFKHADTKRFKAIKGYLGKFARRWGLTGSPAPNGLLDLFGQCYVLDLGRALGQFITHYRNKYFHATGYGGYTWKLNEGADKLIYKAVKPLALRMDADDYIKMPAIIPVPIYVELPPAARKMYDEMEDEFFSVLEGSSFNAVSAASAGIKCEQIANGAIYMDKVDILTGIPVKGKREWQQVHTTKLEALKELVEELQGSPLLCAYHFGHDLARIVKTLGKDTPHMAVSAKEGQKLFDKWNRNELDYLFCHPASVGHGSNLQEGGAHHAGFFHVPYDFELYDQFIRRLRRQGNNAPRVFVYHMIARNTVDEAKMRAINNKGKGQKNFLDALRTYRKQRS
jgi:SNF2 family DNA or RNA helicase